MNALGRNDCVFLDSQSRPYLVTGEVDPACAWLCYWHPDEVWVTLREIRDEDEFNVFHEMALPREQALLYFPGQPEAMPDHVSGSVGHGAK